MVGPGTRHGCPPPGSLVRVKIWISGNLAPRRAQRHGAHQVSSFPGFQPLPGRCVLAGILTRHDAPRDRNASPPVARRGFQFRLLPQGMSEFVPEPSVPWTASYDRVAAEPDIRSQVFVSRHIKSQTLNLFLYNLFSHRKHLHQTKRKRSGLRNLT